MNSRAIVKHLFATAFVAGLLLSCADLGGLGAADGAGGLLGNLACPELGGGAMNANFEADAKANATIRAFVTASGDLASVAAKVESEVGAACERMGNDLGVPAAQMAPHNNEGRVAAACNAVSARMDVILRTGVSASLKAEFTPPQCQVHADAEASCKGQCSAQIDPGYVKAHCDPGHLYGKCDATCSGTCGGTCNGTCAGECQGQGAATPASATAAGRCAGVCKGTCNGSCTADCHGNCTVDFKEPRCDVAVKGPSADAHCEGSCKAHAELTAQCTEPKVKVVATVNTGDMGKLIATLEANLPALIKAELAYGKRIGGDVELLVQSAGDLPSALGQLSAHAGACVAAAASACVHAQASLRVSVQVSASVSAKAGARGGA